MLPVTILTGFLGSGKTTLVRRLLSSPWGRRIGILLNERGVAGIDDLAPGMGSSAGASGFVELTEGCVCCIDQPDLVAALEQLARRGDLERVLLETTGLADPLPITWSVSRPELSHLITLEAVVTVIDVANWEQAPRPEWTAQVEGADVVVLGKLDLVGEGAAERARAAVRALNPKAPQLGPDEALLALVGADTIFSGPSERPAADRALSTAARPAARHSGFHTATVSGDLTYRADALEDLVTDLPASVFRAKGIARVADTDGGVVRWLAFQVVGGRAVVDLTPAAPTHGESRMAFFGRDLEGSALRALRALLDGCLLGAATA